MCVIPWHSTAWRVHGQELLGLATAKSLPGTGAKITKQREGLEVSKSQRLMEWTQICTVLSSLIETWHVWNLPSSQDHSLQSAPGPFLQLVLCVYLQPDSQPSQKPGRHLGTKADSSYTLPNISGLAQTGSEVHPAMSVIMWSFMEHGTKRLYSSKNGNQKVYMLGTKLGSAGDKPNRHGTQREGIRAQVAPELGSVGTIVLQSPQLYWVLQTASPKQQCLQ